MIELSAGNVLPNDTILEWELGKERRMIVKAVDKESHKNYVHINGSACYHVADRVTVK